MKIAIIQMTSAADVIANLDYLTQRIREAASNGAVFISTPENSDFMSEDEVKRDAHVFDEHDHPFIAHFKNLAKELNVWIHLGSIKIKSDDNKKFNRSYLISDEGDIVGHYNKIHLFDVDLPNGEVRRESTSIKAGNKAVDVQTDIGHFGMTVCYDIRFPHLYRTLSKAGADILLIPAAFTVPTGEMHWEVLLRARAIENGAYVIAAAQCGVHDGGRKTYGHSMVINPWGKVIAEAGNEPTIIYADIDQQEIANFRSAIPSLRHDRDITA
jgi:predicted amidohydrolase